ncbi:L-threonylcarbamoyladenylate synthase [Capnocytophaga canis]|uniref:L-threonylcarbamoyladenylate synthase n=1 Tax=Capnocytophaga canis TaxID=1848903 RepID=A0A0B7I2Z4_9FLAO|nr:L-threonylcarbamoyladenylate synthase [Capnocytophaga canis]CEN44163.1 putative ribosome maturation factor rimN [Capnocytophaga canis]
MEKDIKKTVETLTNGGTILYPTDTVWGIGCDATNEAAVTKIFSIKQRNESKSLIVLVDSEQMLRDYTEDVADVVFNFIKKNPEPTTVIYPKAKNLAKNVIAVDNSIGIRLVQDDFCQKIIRQFGKPIVSTSANISGKPTPKIFKEIEAEIIHNCDYVVRYRQMDTKVKSPSRLVFFDSNGNIEFLR